MYKCLNKPVNFDFNFKHVADVHNYNTRNRQNLYLQRTNRNWDKQTFTYHGTQEWNALPKELRETKTFLLFNFS